MAAIHDLLKQVADPTLRARLEAEVERLSKGKKFGLVFEDHLPEATPLYGIPVKVGSRVATKVQDGGALFTVISICDDKAKCRALKDDSEVEFLIDELVPVALCGEPIYPYLEKLDEIDNGGGDLWHSLIQSDNYHALQLLEYLYPGQVDCIYIDPPYNTGAKDWKYNNDYVDGNDAWRHSKWLSMMEKRLKIAKRLLNPKDSVLIVTIDEKEYLHLGMLLEQMFPEARIQMVSSVINPAGVSRGDSFSRTDEYIYFIMFGDGKPVPVELHDDWRGKIKGGYKDKLRWNGLQRSGTSTLRTDRPNMFYPIFISTDGKRFVSVGEPIEIGIDRNSVVAPEGSVAVWPIFPDGREGRWRLGRETLIAQIEKHFVHIGTFKGERTAISYLAQGEQEKVLSGDFPIVGYNEDGSAIVDESNYVAKYIPGSQWWICSHDATQQGAKLLNPIIGSRFTFPKSLYAVHDAIRFFVANKPNALILDFFAGSGTTLHAVNLLNAEDGGKRRCILVTNNEVSNEEVAAFRKKGLKPGDAEWEAKGIARYVTWPRTTCSIKGVNVKGELLKGDYLGPGVKDDGALPGMNTSEKRPLKMSEGFKSNAAFFKLGFLNPTSISLGRAFEKILPVIWMKAGAIGNCPSDAGDDAMLILPENKMAILKKESHFKEFKAKVTEAGCIKTIYLVTDFEPAYKAMAKAFPGCKTYQLYRDYLDNFRLSKVR